MPASTRWLFALSLPPFLSGFWRFSCEMEDFDMAVYDKLCRFEADSMEISSRTFSLCRANKIAPMHIVDGVLCRTRITVLMKYGIPFLMRFRAPRCQYNENAQMLQCQSLSVCAQPAFQVAFSHPTDFLTICDLVTSSQSEEGVQEMTGLFPRLSQVENRI
jgi:hypothetical protein